MRVLPDPAADSSPAGGRRSSGDMHPSCPTAVTSSSPRGDNARTVREESPVVTTATATKKADAVGARAVDAARTALLESVDVVDIGEHLGHVGEDERVVTHFFACVRPGYKGWRWAVTVARAPRAKAVTVDEVVLLPGDEAIVAPEWVPWRDRIKPGDLGPGDLLPTEDDDPRLVPGYTTGDEVVDQDSVREVADELGFGRTRVLSLEGRDLAAQRWYEGDGGPASPLAQSAPAPCSTCGFLLRLSGPLSEMFGVCANGNANDDGRVVSYDHGCGAHSEVQLGKKQQPVPLPDPVLDTMNPDEFDAF